MMGGLILAAIIAWVGAGVWRAIRNNREWRELFRIGGGKPLFHERFIMVVMDVVFAVILGPLLWLKPTPMEVARRKGLVE